MDLAATATHDAACHAGMKEIPMFRTLMTAALVGVIWGIADGEFRAMLGKAFDSVSP